MNENIIKNYSKLRLSLYYLPFFLLSSLFIYLYSNNALQIDSYIQIQKDWFYDWNAFLSQYPQIQYNLTQFGDASIFLSFLTVFIVFAPKIWEALITSAILSALFSKILKWFFSVPRPAAFLDSDTFVIVGKPLTSQTTSLPSGHAITIFTILTVILFSFLPKKNYSKIACYLSFILIGLVLVFTRVGIGAHFPLDVIIGGIIGYISGITGIFINEKYRFWTWIHNKKFYPFFFMLFAVSLAVVISKILKENLVIYYFSATSLIISLYLIVKEYIKEF